MLGPLLGVVLVASVLGAPPTNVEDTVNTQHVDSQYQDGVVNQQTGTVDDHPVHHQQPKARQLEGFDNYKFGRQLEGFDNFKVGKQLEGFVHHKVPVNVHHHQVHQAHQVHQVPVHQQTFGRQVDLHNVKVHKPEYQSEFVKSHMSDKAVIKPEEVVARHNVDTANVVPMARIVEQESEVNPDGTFHNVWNSDNGINVQEQGSLKRVDDVDVAVSQGEISYVDNEGVRYYLKYIADENGFQPQGDHLPTPPPIPLGIARGLEYIAAHPSVETTTYDSNTRTLRKSPTVVGVADKY